MNANWLEWLPVLCIGACILSFAVFILGRVWEEMTGIELLTWVGGIGVVVSFVAAVGSGGWLLIVHSWERMT